MSTSRQFETVYQESATPIDLSKVVVSYAVPVAGSKGAIKYLRLSSRSLGSVQLPAKPGSRDATDSDTKIISTLKESNTESFADDNLDNEMPTPAATSTVVKSCHRCNNTLRTLHPKGPPPMKPFPLQSMPSRTSQMMKRKTLLEGSGGDGKQRRTFWRAMSLTPGERDLYNNYLSNSGLSLNDKKLPNLDNSRLKDFIISQQESSTFSWIERRSKSDLDGRQSHPIPTPYRDTKTSEGRRKRLSLDPSDLSRRTQTPLLADARVHDRIKRKQSRQSSWTSFGDEIRQKLATDTHPPTANVNYASRNDSAPSLSSSRSDINRSHLPITRQTKRSQFSNLPSNFAVRSGAKTYSSWSEGSFDFNSSVPKPQQSPKTVRKIKADNDSFTGYFSRISVGLNDNPYANYVGTRNQMETVVCANCKHLDLQSCAVQLSPRPPLNSPDIPEKMERQLRHVKAPIVNSLPDSGHGSERSRSASTKKVDIVIPT